MKLSFQKLPAAGALFLLSSLLHTYSAQGASLWPPKLSASELEGSRTGLYPLPSTDMVKALEYIESLRQQTRGDEGPAVDYDDLDRLRSLSLASAPKLEELDRNEGRAWEGERSQQWLKALLRALQHTGKEPKPVPMLPKSYSTRQRPEDSDDESQAGNGGYYEGGLWPERGMPAKKYPLIFEDEDSRENPYKRMNENVEEQYTPQSLATLQSVFEELGKLSNPKAKKRHSLDEEQRFYRSDDDDVYRINDVAYEDVTGGEDWTPVEEKVETEEQIKGSREELDRGSDENDLDTVKRSSLPGRFDDNEEPDDFTKLVDYYLLKILEKSEQTENKRDKAEEQNADKRLAQTSYDVNPQAIYQLIDVSRKLQIPPEDLIDMLKNREIKTQARMLEPQEDVDLPDDLEGAEQKLIQISASSKNRGPSIKLYNSKMPEMLVNDLAEDLNTEDVLNILGLESMGNQKAKYLLKQKQTENTPSRYYAPSGRRGDFISSEPSITDKRKSDYDGAVDKDELANYLAAKMIAQYPKVLKKMDVKRASHPSSKEQLAFESLTQDYFDQMASDKSAPSKRLPEIEDIGESAKTQRIDDERLLKILGYISPEIGENEERDLYGKTISGM